MSAQEIRLSELYQEVILDHNRKPRNFGRLPQASCSAHGRNPLCGDDYFVDLVLAEGKVAKIGFDGSGCAISKASASLMTTLVEGKTVKEAELLKDAFLELLTSETPHEVSRQRVGKLKFFEGVRQFPVRVKCAALAWRALEEALKGGKNEITTEEA